MKRSGSIWHPFTQMKTAPPPLPVKSGSGIYLELEDGRRLIDCISSWWVNIHGHAHPAIAKAIYDQALILEQVIFAGFTHEPAEKLASGLLEILPDKLNHIFFSDNGSTSVEVALKLACQFWQNNSGSLRPRFIGFEGGYHGDTAGAMSIGSSSPFWEPFRPLMFAIDTVPYPATWDGDLDVETKENESLSALSKLLETDKGQHAAICIEPLVQGAGGMRMCRIEFLQKLEQFAKDNDLLLIFDEVMTGFGRTGDYFACLKAKVTPDLICLSKGITGGFLPLSVTVCNERIFQAFLSEDHSKTFFHGHSYTANPLACAAAIASLQLLQENKKTFAAMESLHKKLFIEHLAGQAFITNVRFCGTIFAAELNLPGQDGYFHEVGPALRQKFVEQGLLIRPLGNTIYLMPPYCIDTQALATVYATIRQVLDSLL
ncbi:MAG: adenosylmethionine--8-amino-7-oxononanoate transaminase [Candidatus Obscuribacterales bacterium]|nr:adenosylmethionine--8-amino-7-oxononanoate transaminase [Candidatus Obscuribacterales bacterium]